MLKIFRVFILSHPLKQGALPLSSLSRLSSSFQSTSSPPVLVESSHPSSSSQILSKDIFQTRRLQLMNLVHKKSQSRRKDVQNHLVLIPSSTKTYMSDKIPYTFRQNSDFLYLTGYKEPDSVLLLHTISGKSLPEHSSVLFIPKSDKYTVRWEGPKMNPEETVSVLGVDATHYYDELESYLHSFTMKNSNVMLWYDFLSSHFAKIQESMQEFKANYNKVDCDSPQLLLHQLRLLKSEPEVKLMKETCKIAAEALRETIKFSGPFSLESHLHAKMDFECRMRGADYLAFPPVVAGGDRANTIHYISNNSFVNDGDMVLMDAGCEFHGYTSDISRTWPVSGKFSQPQKELYEMILSVQEELIELCKSFPSLDHLFQVMCHKMGSELKKIGIIPITANDEDASRAAYGYCPHHVSHYLGMDVHDTSLISRGINLQPGMVVTVEPGIYIQSDDYRVPEKYRGLCIRIEDDILITDDGPEILTSTCPKHVVDIEQIVSSGK